MNNVSIMIPSYGQFQYTQLCLEYLLSSLGSAKERVTELIIVDTVPVFPWQLDDTQDRLHTLEQTGLPGFPKEWLKIIRLDQNYGCTITINKGIEACQPENDVMFVSNDIFFGDNWLQPLINYAYDPRWAHLVGVVSPYISPEICLDTVINEDFRKHYFDAEYMNVIRSKSAPHIDRWLNKLYPSGFMEFSAQFIERNRGKIYDEGHTAAMMIKRSTIEKIGIFDDRFSYLFSGELGGYGSDDMDYGIRLNNAGLFRVTCFESFCHHLVCGTNQKKIHPDNKDIQSGNKLVEKWEHDEVAPELVFPFDVAGKKVSHRRFKLRETPLPSHKNPYAVDWGLPGQLGLEFMINYNRGDAFPL